MRRLLLLISVTFSGISCAFSQTCTITSSQNWNNASPPTCQDGGNAGSASVIVVPVGLTLTFNDNADTWTGTRIDVFGTLIISAPGSVIINSSVTVKNEGLLQIDSKLNLGSMAGCGYALKIETGGTADLGSGASPRLYVCGNEISRGGPGGCNPYPAGPIPYCAPAGGYTGPSAFDENGYNAILPIKLLYFTANLEKEIIILKWATTMEENFYGFKVQRSADGTSFEDIGEIPGKTFDIYIQSKYSFEDEAPLLEYNYYRLKAIDLDDSFEYFGVKAVKLNGSKKLAVYPNPSSGELISFRTNFSPSESDRIVLVDQLGVEIFNAHASTSQNNISFQNKLHAGIYMLRYISKDIERIVRIVINN